MKKIIVLILIFVALTSGSFFLWPSTPESQVEQSPLSLNFMRGYWDGQNRKCVGPIRWILDEDYRQGHMLGIYDKKNNIHRYSPE